MGSNDFDQELLELWEGARKEQNLSLLRRVSRDLPSQALKRRLKSIPEKQSRFELFPSWLLKPGLALAMLFIAIMIGAKFESKGPVNTTEFASEAELQEIVSSLSEAEELSEGFFDPDYYLEAV